MRYGFLLLDETDRRNDGGHLDGRARQNRPFALLHQKKTEAALLSGSGDLTRPGATPRSSPLQRELLTLAPSPVHRPPRQPSRPSDVVSVLSLLSLFSSVLTYDRTLSVLSQPFEGGDAHVFCGHFKRYCLERETGQVSCGDQSLQGITCVLREREDVWQWHAHSAEPRSANWEGA